MLEYKLQALCWF